MDRPRRAWFWLATLFFLAATSEARDKEKIKLLTPTQTGSTGLFTLQLAETFRQGEFAVGFHAIHFNREPGDLDFTLFPVSLTAGLHDQVELFLSWEAQRRVHADGILVNKISPGDPITTSRLNNPQQTLVFFHDAPFLDLGFGSGPGELRGGVKLNLLSEVRSSPFSLALTPSFKLPLSRGRSRLLKGLSNGSIELGYDLIFSKNLPAGATFTGQSGYLFADESLEVKLPHRFNYGAGVELPLGSNQLRLVGELVGTIFFGPRTGISNPQSPLDLYLGVRIHANHHLSISTAYGANLRTSDTTSFGGVQASGRTGWFLQLSFHRKINRSPTIRCTPSRTFAQQGELVPIRVLITDADDSRLSLNWSTIRGTLAPQGTSAVFDSTGLEAGTYTVTAEVTDGGESAVCTTQITIRTSTAWLSDQPMRDETRAPSFR